MPKKSSFGSYSRLPSGSWRCQIMDGYKPNGKPLMRSFTAPTKGEVQQKVLEFMQERDHHSRVYEQVRFSEWADAWYKDYCTQVQSSTYDNYRYTLNTLKKRFGNRLLTEIRQADINHFFTEMIELGFSSSKITKCKSMLIQIFTSAEENELVSRNPALHAKTVRPAESILENEGGSSGSKDAFTEDELLNLRRYLPNNLIGNSILLMIGTGMRTQELLALRSDDIAADGSSVSVTKAIKTVRGTPQLGVPKSKRSRRVIPVPEDYRVYAIYLRNHSGSKYIWTSEREDGLYSVKHFRAKYYKAISAIPGVRKLSPHSCRHTYITMLQAKGISVELIARLAGHSKIVTTDGYAHTALDTLSNAVSMLNNNERK